MAAIGRATSECENLEVSRAQVARAGKTKSYDCLLF